MIYVNSTIAKIDEHQYKIGTFKISDIILPLGLINLRWIESCISCGTYSEVKTINPNDFTESPVNITTEKQEFIEIESNLSLALKVFSEGPFSGLSMEDHLVNILPCVQPYSAEPLGYDGSEEVDQQFFIDNNGILIISF